MSIVREKEIKAYDILKEKAGITNKMRTPRLMKVVVGTGIGSVNDKNKIKTIQDRLAKITGQKAAAAAAKKSIASFKVREGNTTGYKVTLRGQRMYDFLDRLLTVALPRTRDFRGINRSAVDEMGNMTIGIREHTIFPETADEDLRDVFGFGVTVVSSAENREEALTFFEGIGVPFKKEEEGKGKKKRKR